MLSLNNALVLTIVVTIICLNNTMVNYIYINTLKLDFSLDDFEIRYEIWKILYVNRVYM